VLRGHGIVSRDRGSKAYSLNAFGQLTPAQTQQLIDLCKAKLDAFLDARGVEPWRHRKKSEGYISGTLRYEVLKAAKGRCELCGISMKEKALEVDHIVPRNRGGTDDPSNLQALCYSCNAMKRDRDDTDFRGVLKSYETRETGCPFCEMPADRIILENKLAYAIEDGSPGAESHSLVVTRRHVASLFDLGRPEINACMALLAELRDRIRSEDSSVSGFELRINDGTDPGQTIHHCHWQLIPERLGH
jgi:diadenosine tetraphosphate (Ap4A) HIT family hydrolase